MDEAKLRELMEKEVKAAIQELSLAVEELLQDTTPQVPLPKPPRHHITPRHFWPVPPGPDDAPGDNYRRLGEWRADDDGTYYRWELKGAAWEICKACGWNPRDVLQAIHKLEAAAKWCRARAEERRQMARELLREQAQAIEELEARAALRTLAQGGKR